MHSYQQTLTDPKRYSAKKHVVPVNFYCQAPEAKQVSIMGDFNRWNAHSHALTRMPDGAWRCQIPLNHGHHQYVFVVDGQPVLDPRASGVSRNAKNERVSMLFVS